MSGGFHLLLSLPFFSEMLDHLHLLKRVTVTLVLSKSKFFLPIIFRATKVLPTFSYYFIYVSTSFLKRRKQIKVRKKLSVLDKQQINDLHMYEHSGSVKYPCANRPVENISLKLFRSFSLSDTPKKLILRSHEFALAINNLLF